MAAYNMGFYPHLRQCSIEGWSLVSTSSSGLPPQHGTHSFQFPPPLLVAPFAAAHVVVGTLTLQNLCFDTNNRQQQYNFS
jgi:hypothetical protein